MGCRVVSLGDVIQLEDSKRQPLSSRERDSRKGGYPYYGAQGIVDYLDDYTYEGDYLLVAEDGENLRSRKQPIANAAHGRFRVNNHAHVIAATKRCNLTYLRHLLNSMDVTAYVTGSTQPKLSQTSLLNMKVELPEIDKQDAIAAFLHCLDVKIATNSKLNGYLEELARAVYVSAMQEHADIASLCDLAEFNPETYSPKENWSAVSYIDTSALMLNDLAGLQHFNPAEEKLPTRARRKVSNGDILYSTVRPNQNHYGLLYSPEPHTLASTAFAVIRPNDTIMSPLVYLALTDVRITKTLQQLAETSTSTIPSIRPVDLERIAVLVPSDEYGSEIANQIGTTFKQIDCNKRENRKLAAFRDALLPKLMSDEIDVSKIDLTQLNSHLAECIQVINQSAIEPNLSPYLANQPFAGKFFVCCSKSVFGSIELFSIFFFSQFFNSLFEWPVKLFAICLHRVQDNLVLINRKQKRLISINELGDYRFRLTFEHESRFHRKGLHLIELQMKPQLMLAFKYMRNSGSNLLKKSRIGQQLKA